MDDHKFIMTEEETFQLFKEFFIEALRFLNVPQESYPRVVNTLPVGSDGKYRPVYFDYDNDLIMVSVRFFRVMATYNLPSGNDGPSAYRATAYKAAYMWNFYISYGEKRDYSSDTESTAFAQALMIVKGVPLLPPIFDNNIRLIIKSVLGIDPNDRRPMLKMLEQKFGMPCQVRRRYDVANGKYREFVSLVPQEQERRSQELLKL